MAAGPRPTPASEPVAAAEPVQGFVEAVGPAEIHGWAWSPGAPGARLRIELHAGGAVLDATLADRPRPDLARNGIGDGAHAFVLPMPQDEPAALRLVAVAPDGTVVPLPGAPEPPGRRDETRRMLEQLVASQRVLHRNLQAVLLAAKAREPVEAALDRVATTQAALDARAAELELFVARLDLRLAALDAARPSGRGAPRGRAAVVAALGLFALGLAGLGMGLLG